MEKILLSALLGRGEKGLAANKTITQWQLLSHEVSLPAAVIHKRKLLANIQWMQSFADESNVLLAPHGKTTMVPYIFQQQLVAGAWAITLATAPQVQTAVINGIKRVVMANQLVGQANMEMIADLVKYQQLEFYCLVDSIDNVNQLGQFFAQADVNIHLLIELGVTGGRCGCRTTEQVYALAEVIAKYPCLSLSGIEFYEGVFRGDNTRQQVQGFLQQCNDLIVKLIEDELFDTPQPVISGAGSAWYDLVVEAFTELMQRASVQPVIRPGCYVTHDTGIYQQAQNALLARSQHASAITGQLENALTVWAYVQSVAEPGMAIIGLGKRDIAYDAGLPKIEQIFRDGNALNLSFEQGLEATHIMDQHLFIQLPTNIELKVGDIVVLSGSHPCLTFDKWRYLCLADDDYKVTDVVATAF